MAVGQQSVAVDATTVAPSNLGILAELLQARAVVNALLDRLVPVRDGPSASAEEERSRCLSKELSGKFMLRLLF